MFENTNDILNSIISHGVPGNDIIIYHKGEEVYRSFRGYSDAENKIPMNGNELYNIYSASKLFTCTAALQLVEKGLLKLETPLWEYIPEFKKMYVKTDDGVALAKNEITIKHLFTMTAGFDYNVTAPVILEAQKNTNGRCPTVETVKYLSQQPLSFEPGTKWQYSLCHDVLAAVVEIICGKRFGAYVDENIFKPLGMTNTTFLLPKERLDDICAQYRFIADDNSILRVSNEVQSYKFGSEYESGGAGAISTVTDYIKFLEALRIGDTVLKSETIDMMITDQIAGVDAEYYWQSNAGYGYGLGVRCPIGIDGIYDFGWGGAAGAFMAVEKENNFSLYYGQHVLNTGAGDGRSELIYAVRKDLGI